MQQVEKQGFVKAFKLKSSIAATNMVLFDAEGKIAKYTSALDILQDFIKLRKTMYNNRKAYLVAKLTREKEILSNKARFILMVVKGELELRKRKKAELLKELEKKGFKKMSELDAICEKATKNAKLFNADQKPEEEQEAAKGDGDEDAAATDYNYLLIMPLWSLTFEKVEELKKQHEIKQEELNELRKTTIETMWDRNLEELSKALDEIDALEAQEAEEAEQAAGQRRSKDGAKRAGGAAALKRKATMKPKASGKKVDDDDDAAEDKKLFKKGLQEGAADSVEVAKQTWGSGAAPARRNNSTDDGAGDDAPAKKRGRPAASGSGFSGEALRGRTASEPSKAVSPPKEKEPETGAGLLARLLGARSVPSAARSLDTTALPTMSALSGGEGMFDYLKTSSPGDSKKTFSVLDDLKPPGIADLETDEPGEASKGGAAATKTRARKGEEGGEEKAGKKRK